MVKPVSREVWAAWEGRGVKPMAAPLTSLSSFLEAKVLLRSYSVVMQNCAHKHWLSPASSMGSSSSSSLF